jgi:hypothetical protein
MEAYPNRAALPVLGSLAQANPRQPRAAMSLPVLAHRPAHPISLNPGAWRAWAAERVRLASAASLEHTGQPVPLRAPVLGEARSVLGEARSVLRQARLRRAVDPAPAAVRTAAVRTAAVRMVERVVTVVRSVRAVRQAPAAPWQRAGSRAALKDRRVVAVRSLVLQDHLPCRCPIGHFGRCQIRHPRASRPRTATRARPRPFATA